MDHSILLARLHDILGISGKALEWFSSYLSNRVQAVSVNGGSRHKRSFTMGSSQGSVLGPVLFCRHSQAPSEVIFQSRCGHHKCADNTLVRRSSTPFFYYLFFRLQMFDFEECFDFAGRSVADDW